MRCTDPTCSGADRPHEHLSMPDPCPHVTRMDVIRAKLDGEPIPTCGICR